MTALAQTWWAAISGFVLAALSVLRGDLNPLSIVALAGIVCLVAGVILLLVWRVRHAARAIALIVAALLSPIGVGVANGILGWLGMLFAVLAGALFLVIGTAIIASNADRRLPVWLIGAFSILLATYCAAVGGAFAVFG
jgi:hypothetical protein